jgi:phosphate starvation-inducible PhoH-like protein
MPDSPVVRTIIIEDRDEAVILFGTRDQYLRALRDAFAVKAVYRNRAAGGRHREGAEHFERALQQVRQVARKHGLVDRQGRLERDRGDQGRDRPRAARRSPRPKSGRNLRTRTDGQGGTCRRCSRTTR